MTDISFIEEMHLSEILIFLNVPHRQDQQEICFAGRILALLNARRGPHLAFEFIELCPIFALKLNPDNNRHFAPKFDR